MTKIDFIHYLQQVCQLDRQDAIRVVEAFFSGIESRLARQESVKLSGFGTFMIRSKAARRGRNPKTGEEIAISARRVIVFYPSSVLKKQLNPE